MKDIRAGAVGFALPKHLFVIGAAGFPITEPVLIIFGDCIIVIA